MDTENTAECFKSTMTLREPKKKRRVRLLRPSKPLPLNIGPDGELIVYTGHLSSLGVCIVDSEGIRALHSDGFFGKGSLSRSYPCFEKTKPGLPRVVRHRQWARRQEWLRQAEALYAQAKDGDSNDEKWENVGKLDSEDMTEVETENDESQRVAEKDQDVPKQKEKVAEAIEFCECSIPPEKKLKFGSPDLVGTSKGCKYCQDSERSQSEEPGIVVLDIKDTKTKSQNDEKTSPKSQKTDIISLNTKTGEIVLDSDEEEDEIREISSTDSKKPEEQKSVHGDMDVVVLLKEEKVPVDSEESDPALAENQEVNEDDDVQMLERELLVLQDSDSDVENYLTNVKPTIEKEGFPVRETLHLTSEETFFLMFGLGCLQVIDYDGNVLNISEAWNHFCGVQKDFVQRYVVYHYFRSHGWVVKPGLKYGGDYLLYKQGPPFYHASYIVIVEVVDADTLLRDKTKTTRQMTWKKLFGLDRLSETAAKEILFAQVLWPSSIPRNEIPSSPDLLAKFTVAEILCRRWIPKQNREEINVEDNADESRR